MSETIKFEMTPAKRKAIDKLVREVKGEAAVEAALDHRYSSREATDKKAGWGAYERFLLSDGHTVFVSLDTMKATKSTKPDKYAQAKVEKREARAAKKAERKAAREAKTTKATKKEKQTVKKAVELIESGKVSPAEVLIKGGRGTPLKPKKAAVVDPLAERKPEPVQA